MTEKTEKIRPVNFKPSKMADEIGEDRILYNACCLCGKKRELLSFKQRKVCGTCLNFVKNKFN